MSGVAPHLAFPARFDQAAGQFVTVEQSDPAHVIQCGEVTLRTTPGDFDHQPELGLRQLVGELGDLSPAVLDALEQFEPRKVWMATDDVTHLEDRIRTVWVSIAQEDAAT